MSSVHPSVSPDAKEASTASLMRSASHGREYDGWDGGRGAIGAGAGAGADSVGSTMVTVDVDGPHGEGTVGEDGAVETSEETDETRWTVLGVRSAGVKLAVRGFFVGWAKAERSDEYWVRTEDDLVRPSSTTGV